LKQSQPKKQKPDYLPVLKRMQLNADFLRLCFILSGKKIWFQIDPHTGIIEPLNGETDEQYHFHFALKKVGKARGNLHRGRNDILVSFVKNAMRYCSKNDPHYLNDNAHRETIWKKLDHLTNQFMEKLESESVNKARKASGRHAIAWEIYGILKRYHNNRMAMLHLESFMTAFPSLLKILYPGFLNSCIIPGKSLKKEIPYWSKLLRKQAQKHPGNYEDAKYRIMTAVAVSLGAPKNVEERTVKMAMLAARFMLPFQKQPRFKEAYLVWMLKQDEFREPTFRTWYDYIKSSQHVVNRYTSMQSLERRYNEWIFEELTKQGLKEREKRYPGHCTGYQIGKLNREQLDIMGKWFPSFADDPAEESSTLYTDTQDWERYL
jgi:hypothetical protein